MKDATINSLSQPSILSKQAPRLEIITGKGGVGKTTVSMALTALRNKQGIRTRYLCFKDKQRQSLIDALSLPILELSLDDSVLLYLEMKLKSKTISKWIASSNFFQALFNMLPSLADMVILGHIIKLLKEDPDLHIIVDSPSSGHAMALFQTTDLWHNIFQSGPLVKDIEMMKNFLNEPNNFAIRIVTLPTDMSIEESDELIQQIEESSSSKPTQFVNNILSLNESLSRHSLPQFLKLKIAIEDQLIENIQSPITKIPHFIGEKPEDVIQAMVNHYA